MTLTKTQRQCVFQMFGGKCAYCGCDLPVKGWHADHVDPVIRDGEWVRVDEPGRSHKYVQTGKCLQPLNNRLDNFFPACRACNIEKSCDTVEDFRAGLQRKVEILRRDNAAFRHAERFGLAAQTKAVVVFHFETWRAS